MTKRKPQVTKVEITHRMTNLLGPSEIVIDGRQVEGVGVTVESNGVEGAAPTVRIDGGRPLYETEVWLNGVLMARVDGLLTGPTRSSR